MKRETFTIKMKPKSHHVVCKFRDDNIYHRAHKVFAARMREKIMKGTKGRVQYVHSIKMRFFLSSFLTSKNKIKILQSDYGYAYITCRLCLRGV